MGDPPPQTADPSADARATSERTLAAAGTSVRPTVPDGERYQLLAEIARGGMGVVYRATDTALGREVAVKVLQDRFDPNSGAARRFADEARIAAQLQHPGIPPVHDLATLPDGRPLLAMKLIKGQTLEELLAARPDVAAERGRFLAAFEAVCQALAYAHAHMVIHRDLKPANVMVGTFGEVQVMDWGLAKVLTGQPADTADPEATTAGTHVVSLRESDGALTQAGSVLGTPAFMPPEQAAGLVAKVDARSDVFGLGAILAVILTGQPPFAAASAETTRGLAARGKVEDCFARLDRCGADPELIALCKCCLAPEKGDRPADAGHVARAVGALRAAADERARRAELERVQAEADKAAAQLQAAEQTKRRRVQLALFAAVAALVLGGGAFAWWSRIQAEAGRERLARNAEAVAGFLDHCEAALRGGDTARAALSLEAAQKRAAEGGADESAGRLDALATDLALLRDLDTVDQFRWTPLDGKSPDEGAVAARFREVLGRYGADPDAVSPEEAVARALGSVVRDRIMGAWDWLLRVEKTAGVHAALQVVDADPYRDEVRHALQIGDGKKLADLAGGPAALEQPLEFTACLGESAWIRVERRRQLLEAALRRRPGDLGLLMTLGNTYPLNQEQGADERLRWLQAAVAAAPTNPAAHLDLGTALYDRHDLAGAEAAYREAIRVDPKSAWAHDVLGWALMQKGDLEGAVAEFQEAIRLDPRYAAAHNNLGWTLAQKGDLEGAVAEYREALRLDPRYASAHSNLGWALQAKGDLEGAVAEFQEVLRIDPKQSEALVNLPRAERMRSLLPRLGDILQGKATPQTSDEACVFAYLCGQQFQKRYAAAVRLYEDAFTADPKLAADLQAGHRYDAACSAVLAAGGEGMEPPADAAAQTALRQKALGWLRAELDLHRRQAAAADGVERATAADTLHQWLAETDLSGVREPGPLAKLPAAEREEWEKLWADVKATLADARKPLPPAGKSAAETRHAGRSGEQVRHRAQTSARFA